MHYEPSLPHGCVGKCANLCMYVCTSSTRTILEWVWLAIMSLLSCCGGCCSVLLFMAGKYRWTMPSLFLANSSSHHIHCWCHSIKTLSSKLSSPIHNYIIIVYQLSVSMTSSNQTFSVPFLWFNIPLWELHVVQQVTKIYSAAVTYICAMWISARIRYFDNYEWWHINIRTYICISTLCPAHSLTVPGCM